MPNDIYSEMHDYVPVDEFKIHVEVSMNPVYIGNVSSALHEFNTNSFSDIQCRLIKLSSR